MLRIATEQEKETFVSPVLAMMIRKLRWMKFRYASSLFFGLFDVTCLIAVLILWMLWPPLETLTFVSPIVAFFTWCLYTRGNRIREAEYIIGEISDLRYGIMEFFDRETQTEVTALMVRDPDCPGSYMSTAYLCKDDSPKLECF